MQTKKGKKRAFKNVFDEAQDAHCEPAKKFKESTSTSSPNNHRRAPSHARYPSTSNSHREQTNDKKPSRIIESTEHDESDTQRSDVDHQEFEAKRKKFSSREGVTHVSRTSNVSTTSQPARVQPPPRTQTMTPGAELSRTVADRWRSGTAGYTGGSPTRRESASPAARVPPPPPVQPAVDERQMDYTQLLKEKLKSTSGGLPIPCCGLCNLWCALHTQIVLEVLAYISIVFVLFIIAIIPIFAILERCKFSMSCIEHELWFQIKAFCVMIWFLIGIAFNFGFWRALHDPDGAKANTFIVKILIDVVFLLLGTVEPLATGVRFFAGDVGLAGGGLMIIFFMFHIYRIYKVYSWARHLENGGTFTRDWKMKMD